ncbi:MAG: hypothetical protein SGPRY_003712 [Prymnesium sp.]
MWLLDAISTAYVYESDPEGNPITINVNEPYKDHANSWLEHVPLEIGGHQVYVPVYITGCYARKGEELTVCYYGPDYEPARDYEPRREYLPQEDGLNENITAVAYTKFCKKNALDERQVLAAASFMSQHDALSNTSNSFSARQTWVAIIPSMKWGSLDQYPADTWANVPTQNNGFKDFHALLHHVLITGGVHSEKARARIIPFTSQSQSGQDAAVLFDQPVGENIPGNTTFRYMNDKDSQGAFAVQHPEVDKELDARSHQAKGKRSGTYKLTPAKGQPVVHLMSGKPLSVLAQDMPDSMIMAIEEKED